MSDVVGTYGLSLVGNPEVAHLLGRVAADSPPLTVRQFPWADTAPSVVGADWDYVADLLGGGQLRMVRGSGVAEFHVPEPFGPDETAHPVLAPAAAMASHWAGRSVLHAGVVASEGVAVAVVGDREAGKSTLMAWLARDPRFDVLSDDLAVIEENVVHAGPRCVDLRPPTAERLVDEDVRVVREGTRFRLDLRPCPSTARFLGVVALGWGAEIDLYPVAPVHRLPGLHRHATVEQTSSDLRRVLALAARPMWGLRRPQSWDLLPATVERLGDLLAGARV